MTKIKITTSFVEVFKVKGETMDIAFHNLKSENSFDNYNLQLVTSEFNTESIDNGKILKHSQFLYREYLNNKISEYTIFGALYNKKPIIKDGSKIITHNIISKGTKKWETINSYRFDNNEVIFENIGTKAESFEKAKELALENNKTVNIIVSKRLVDMDGILGIAEFIPFENIDDTNIYIFWKYGTKIEEKEEDDFIDENVEKDDIGQLSIKEDLFGFYGRQKILNSVEV